MNGSLREALRETGPWFILLAGFVLWSGAFVVLYSAQAIGCSLGWDGIEIAGLVTVQRTVLIVLFLILFALHLALYLVLRRSQAALRERTGDPTTFSGVAATHLALGAFFAFVFCFWGVFFLSAC